MGKARWKASMARDVQTVPPCNIQMSLFDSGSGEFQPMKKALKSCPVVNLPR